MYKTLVLATPELVRERINQVDSKSMSVFLKLSYLLGSRVGELTGRMCPKDNQNGKTIRKPVVYGPRGTDVSREDFNCQKAVVFDIKIEKKKFNLTEEIPHRFVAIPLNSKYEPWTQEIYEYFNKKGEDFVFPFTRQYIWRYIKLNKVFDGLGYPVERYDVWEDGEIVRSSPRKINDFGLHGMRHVRTKELSEVFQFNGLDLMAYIGWSARSAVNETGDIIPPSVEVYMDIYTNWRRYFPKLLKKRFY